MKSWSSIFFVVFVSFEFFVMKIVTLLTGTEHVRRSMLT